MKQLQTYFALFATLLVVLATAVACAAAVLLYDADPAIAYVLLPTAAIVLIIGLAVGHYLAEPLQALAAHIEVCRQSGKGSVSPESTLYAEVDTLSKEVNLLVQDCEDARNQLALLDTDQASFVSDVAHELRTPLTAIRGNAEMLLDPDLPPELHDRFCNSIVEQSERLSRLTGDLITLQRERSEDRATQWRRVNLRDVAQDAVDALAPILHEHNAQLSIEGEAPDVLGDRDKLIEVVTNLVDNATRFIEPGGHIWIQLAGTESSSVISVADDGTGFGDIDPHRLFERFYRTDFSRARNSGGSGLGLAIVKSIVEAHDGSVDAFNRPEGGACFMVAIPSIAQER